MNNVALLEDDGCEINQVPKSLNATAERHCLSTLPQGDGREEKYGKAKNT